MRRLVATSHLSAVVARRLDRRGFLSGSLGASLLAFLDGCATGRLPGRPGGSGPALGFPSIPVSKSDAVLLPPGYTYTVVNAWGDPIMPGAPPFRPDASQTAAEQAQQSGMHHDGMMYFPLPRGATSSDHGLLAVNFEYTDDNLLTTEGMEPWTAEKVAKSKNAHGLGVFEVKLVAGRWQTIADSRFGRRITVDTPIAIGGPAAGHPLLKTAADPEGRTVRGTLNNCAAGRTPWGTYLACEENIAPYFVNDEDKGTRLAQRYGIPTSKESWGYRWHEFDERFNAGRHPNEPNRFGWVVEVDPYDPQSQPVKRTALGRMAHEGATLATAADGRVVYYMGDDDFRWKFEHIYKFVSARPVQPGGAAANRDTLDHGVLHVARFDPDGTGVWLPLVAGQGALAGEPDFATHADVLVRTRLAADVAGGTYMDRPEWVAVHPSTGEAYCSLTNNTSRGKAKPAFREEVLGADAANPTAPNVMGHIIRWREEGGDAGATRFRWDIFLRAGDPAHKDADKKGNVKGDVAFAQPDGLYFDGRGVLWIQTDASTQAMVTPDWNGIGNNQLLAADPATGDVRRFLTGPVGCELTGIQMTPDQRTLFVNIQHPGEAPRPHPGRNDPKDPNAHSNWPDGPTGGRPRSATIAIRRTDGGVVGT